MKCDTLGIIGSTVRPSLSLPNDQRRTADMGWAVFDHLSQPTPVLREVDQPDHHHLRRRPRLLRWIIGASTPPTFPRNQECIALNQRRGLFAARC